METQNPSPQGDVYKTAEQVAEYLNLSVGTVYNKVSAGEIPCHKFGPKIVRFRQSEVDAWLKEQEEKMRQKKSSASVSAPAPSPVSRIPQDLVDIILNNPETAPAFLRKQFGK